MGDWAEPVGTWEWARGLGDPLELFFNWGDTRAGVIVFVRFCSISSSLHQGPNASAQVGLAWIVISGG